MGSTISESALLMVLLMIGVWGCSTSDKVVGRYKSAVCQTEGSPPTSCTSVVPKASAYAVSIKTPPGSSPSSGTAFPERALAAYIDVLGNPKLSSTAKDLRTNLAATLAPTSSASAEDVRTLFHRTLIVTVRKEGAFNPADRLEATDVTIKPDKARFVSWDTLATAYTTINAGTVQLTQARGETESLTVGTPSVAPISGSASGAASQTNTKVENYTAAIQAETLSATIEQNGGALVIHRQGGQNVDLTGNTVIKVDMSYAGNPMSTYIFSVPKYKDTKDKWLPPEKVTLAVKPVSAVPPDTVIKADVILVYTLRHVKLGDTTYEEKDDNVLELTSQPITRSVDLIPAREASPPGFGLVATAGSAKDFALNVEQPGRDPVGLCFDTYNEASDFLTYLKVANAKSPSKIGDSRLGFVEPPDPRVVLLTATDLDGLEARAKCF
jgi:hypothetical protein